MNCICEYKDGRVISICDVHMEIYLTLSKEDSPKLEELVNIELSFVELGWLSSCVMLMVMNEDIHHKISKTVMRKIRDKLIPLMEKQK